MRKTVIACALLLALPLTAPAAEICESIDAAATGWDQLSQLIDETQGDGFSEEETAKLTDAIGKLTEASATLAGMLQGGGNEDQQALGKELEEVLTKFASLDGSADIDYAVSVIDEVTNAMDKVTEDCEAAHGE